MNESESLVLPLHHSALRPIGLRISNNAGYNTQRRDGTMVRRDGVAPPESMTADLQSAPLLLTVYRRIIPNTKNLIKYQLFFQALVLLNNDGLQYLAVQFSTYYQYLNKENCCLCLPILQVIGTLCEPDYLTRSSLPRREGHVSLYRDGPLCWWLGQVPTLRPPALQAGATTN